MKNFLIIILILFCTNTTTLAISTTKFKQKMYEVFMETPQQKANKAETKIIEEATRQSLQFLDEQFAKIVTPQNKTMLIKNGIIKPENNDVASIMMEMLLADDLQVVTYHDKWLFDKNNMKNAYEYYKICDAFSSQYKEMLELYDKNYYKKALEIYNGILGYNSTNEKLNEAQYLQNQILNRSQPPYCNTKIKPLSLSEYKQTILQKSKYAEFNNHLELMYNTFNSGKNEVSKYGYNYEQKKVENFMSTHNRAKNYGSLANFVYNPYATTPEMIGIYHHYPNVDFPLKVVQAFNGGVLLSGSHMVGHYDFKNIFVQSSTPYASGQLIAKNSYFKYIGLYSYKTVLGAQQTVWKFKQLSSSEVKQNFDIGNTLYFYQPY